MSIFQAFVQFTGATNTSGAAYGWWSGFGSDIAEFAILGVVWRKLNCHVDGCYRLGLHHVPGTGFTTCRRHHPTIEGKVSPQHIAEVTRQGNIVARQNNQTNQLTQEIHKHLNPKKPLGRRP